MKFKLDVCVGNITGFPSFPNNYDFKLSDYLKKLVKDIDTPKEFDDWIVSYKLCMFGDFPLKISKRGIAYTQDKEKEMYINIPIPKKSMIKWGIDDDRFCYSPPVELKHFYTIKIDYKKFNSLDEYVIYCGKKAILESLSIGFTLKGAKIVIKK